MIPSFPSEIPPSSFFCSPCFDVLKMVPKQIAHITVSKKRNIKIFKIIIIFSQGHSEMVAKYGVSITDNQTLSLLETDPFFLQTWCLDNRGTKKQSDKKKTTGDEKWLPESQNGLLKSLETEIHLVS